MTMDAIYEERRSDWSQQDLVVGTTRWLQCDQTLPLSAKGVACETIAQWGEVEMVLPVWFLCTNTHGTHYYTMKIHEEELCLCQR